MGRPKLDPDTINRRCIACREVKPLSEFYSHKGMALGKSYTCKTCDKVKRAARAMLARGVCALRRQIQADEIVLAQKKRALFLLGGGSW